MSTVELIDHTFLLSARTIALLKNTILFHLRYSTDVDPDNPGIYGQHLERATCAWLSH